MVVPGNKLHLPESLRRTRPVKPAFDHARDPLISAQLNAMAQTESQRRAVQGTGGQGSTMVKSDRPHPELRPKHESSPKRSAFNQAWLREQREAALAHMAAQRGERGPEHLRTRGVQAPSPERGR